MSPSGYLLISGGEMKVKMSSRAGTCVFVIFCAVFITLQGLLVSCSCHTIPGCHKLGHFPQNSDRRKAAEVVRGWFYWELLWSVMAAVPSWSASSCCVHMWGPLRYVCLGTCWGLTLSAFIARGWWSSFFLLKLMITSLVFLVFKVRLLTVHHLVSLWTSPL